MLRVLLWAYIFILEPWGNMAIRLGKESGNFLEKVALKILEGLLCCLYTESPFVALPHPDFYVAHDGLKLIELHLPLLPVCWSYRYAPPLLGLSCVSLL